MRYLLIATHSHLADGFLSSCRYFLPTTENITVCNAYVDGLDDAAFKQSMDAFFASKQPEDEIIAFTDIAFGSVNQYLSLFLTRHPHYHLLAGINLALLLEVATKPTDEYLSVEDLQRFTESARQSVVYMNAMHSVMNEDDE